jgi:hypothetical protein
VNIGRPQLARLYGLVLGTGLLVEGSFYLLINALQISAVDVPHNTLHVVWGATILGMLLVNRSNLVGAVVMLVFGVFYTALAVAGIVSTNPFGLLLGPGENAFHFTVGPLALVLGAWSLSAG